MTKRQPTAHAGKKLGRYRIERELGRGGMGVVYLARDEQLDKRVALKTTSVAGLGSGEKSRSQRRSRFIREVKALTQVNHENVVQLFDAGEKDDADLGWLLFYTMQFVDGTTLAELVQQGGPLEPAAAAAVCMQVAYGLGAAHKRGIIHRDIKPANVFLTGDNRALIGDFGICKIEGSTQITRRDQLVGTPNYLAPEQILGETISPATDIFALGALFYIITTNRPLRDRVDPASLLRSATTNDAYDRVMREKRIPRGLRKVVGRALRQDPKERYANGDEFAEAIAAFASKVPSLPARQAPSSPPPRPAPKTPVNPFAPKPKADFSNVEDAAEAFLHDVADEPSPLKDLGALPVAQTESTAMFNLRAYEEQKARGLLGGTPRSALEDDTSDVEFATEITEVTEAPSAETIARIMAKQPANPVHASPSIVGIHDEKTQALPQPVAIKKKPTKPLPPLTAMRKRLLIASAGAGALTALVLVLALYFALTPSTPKIPPPNLDAAQL